MYKFHSKLMVWLRATIFITNDGLNFSKELEEGLCPRPKLLNICIGYYLGSVSYSIYQLCKTVFHVLALPEQQTQVRGLAGPCLRPAACCPAALVTMNCALHCSYLRPMHSA